VEQESSSKNGRTPEASNETQNVTIGGGDQAEEDAYLAELQRHLAQHYEYPRRARRLGQEGTVSLTIGFNRDGSLNRTELVDRSGYGILDEAAVEMLQRAEPLPRVPDKIEGDTFRLQLPIRFQMR
jgi:protein TonB